MTLLAEPPVLMTAEEFLNLPDEQTDRDLIRGLPTEPTMTMRGRRHTRAGTNVAHVLNSWLLSQPRPAGEVLTGEAAFRLTRDPDTLVGIDVAYMSATTAAANPDDAFIIDGVPILAVEILSPSDTQQAITGKVKSFLSAGVPLVWVAEPVFQTVTVFRPDSPPELFNVQQQLTGGTHLPGFAVDVALLFGPATSTR